jgi:hypothetical protein
MYFASSEVHCQQGLHTRVKGKHAQITRAEQVGNGSAEELAAGPRWRGYLFDCSQRAQPHDRAQPRRDPEPGSNPGSKSHRAAAPSPQHGVHGHHHHGGRSEQFDGSRGLLPRRSEGSRGDPGESLECLRFEEQRRQGGCLMGAASSVAAAPTLVVADVNKGIAEIKECDTVQRWIRRGKPVEDIDMEVPNVKHRMANRPAYLTMRDRLCKKYKIDESELVRTLLHQLQLLK